MEFIRNILIASKDSQENESIRKHLDSKSTKIKTHSISNRLQMTEAFSKIDIRCVCLNTNLGRTDAIFITRFFSMLREQHKAKIAIFVLAEDFELANELLSLFPLDKVIIINTPLDIQDLLRKMSLELFNNLSLIESEQQKSKVKSDLDVDLEFINVFITYTKSVLKEMAQLEKLNHSAPILMSKYQGKLVIDISARILISSSYFRGSYFIAFPQSTFLSLYEKVVMEKCTGINAQNKDLAGELANIIYGKCKKKFSDEGVNLEMVIPSIYLGPITHPIVIVIPFDTDLGPFYVAVAPGHI
jgi:CheY-specific phosphatase CheX